MKAIDSQQKRVSVGVEYVQRALKSFFVVLTSVIISGSTLVACGVPSSQSELGFRRADSERDSERPVNFRLNLTDTPIDEIKSVFVNIKYVELRLKKDAQEVKLHVAREMGQVDLLTLQNGVLKNLATFHIPEGVVVRQVRLVLKSEGNYLVYEDDSTCELKTPSAQQSGIKILIPQSMKIKANYDHELTVDFDAKKSLKLFGRSGCFLNPVVRVHTAHRVKFQLPDSAESPDSPESIESDEDFFESLLPPGEQPDQIGWDQTEETKMIPYVEVKDLPRYFQSYL